jgi:hypothetical protein
MRAWTDAVPQSSPMVKVTGTGFTVPVKLATAPSREHPLGGIPNPVRGPQHHVVVSITETGRVFPLAFVPAGRASSGSGGPPRRVGLGEPG